MGTRGNVHIYIIVHNSQIGTHELFYYLDSWIITVARNIVTSLTLFFPYVYISKKPDKDNIKGLSLSDPIQASNCHRQ